MTLFLKLTSQRENCKFVNFNHPTPVCSLNIYGYG